MQHAGADDETWAQGIKLVVDNTFSPMMISPARWGADLVIHSLTKFVSGASDVIAGAPRVIVKETLRMPKNFM